MTLKNGSTHNSVRTLSSCSILFLFVSFTFYLILFFSEKWWNTYFWFHIIKSFNNIHQWKLILSRLLFLVFPLLFLFPAFFLWKTLFSFLFGFSPSLFCICFCDSRVWFPFYLLLFSYFIFSYFYSGAAADPQSAVISFMLFLFLLFSFSFFLSLFLFFLFTQSKNFFVF